MVFIVLMILFVVLGIELIPALIPGERLFLSCPKQVHKLIPSSGPSPPEIGLRAMPMGSVSFVSQFCQPSSGPQVWVGG